MLELVDLGEDIIVSNVIPYLKSADIFSLSMTSQLLHNMLTTNETYHQLYLKHFGTKPVPLNLESYCWEELFKLRISSKAKFYTWGTNDFGRLGHDPRDLLKHKRFGGIDIPLVVNDLEGKIITAIEASGYSFQVLTNSGELYWTGQLWKKNYSSSPGPIAKDFEPPPPPRSASGRNATGIFGIPGLPGMARRYQNPHPRESSTSNNETQIHAETNPNLRLPPEEQVNRLNLANVRSPRPKLSNTHQFHLPIVSDSSGALGPKLISISSGREHVIGLDEEGKVYSWDTGISGSTGVEMIFPNIPYEDHKVTKISAGWNLSACFVENHGLIVWYSRESISKEQYYEQDFKAKANYILVPGTQENRIIDFLCGVDYVLYIKGNGKLYRFDIDAQGYFDGRADRNLIGSPFEVHKFNQWLSNLNLEIVGEGVKFSKITGCYHSFAIFTNDGRVLLGDSNRSRYVEIEDDSDDDEDENGPRNPIVLPQLQQKNIVDVVMGDYHFLALTDDGDLFSWGRESKQCGCLGLGPLNLNQVVELPTHVKEPIEKRKGKWLAVTAAGWQTGGIYILTDGEEEGSSEE
ncbi:SCF-associated factor 1 [[Candida] railenensis]|uniref:SCF-associated factor 1 n=1 Tax=[Candida] railenensis TaxID=45579 RepID=A0A9P0QMB5_9ASCO|nr:SCF-associated factor 1 [[Candida] railenensis]